MGRKRRNRKRPFQQGPRAKVEVLDREKGGPADVKGPTFDIRVRERSNISFSPRDDRPPHWGAPGGMRAAAGGRGG